MSDFILLTTLLQEKKKGGKGEGRRQTQKAVVAQSFQGLPQSLHSLPEYKKEECPHSLFLPSYWLGF